VGAQIYVGSTPQLYEAWLAETARQTLGKFPPEERIVFVNAWNEWAEHPELEVTIAYCITAQNHHCIEPAVIDAYARIGLHRFWGSGESASADGMKWDVHPESLKSSYHIRYGGYGGIGYYLVSDTYIALFSKFIPVGVWEAVHIIQGCSTSSPG